MKSLVFLVVFVFIFVATTSGQNFSVASPTDDYFDRWNRKFDVDIFQANMRIECVDNRGADVIRVIKDQQDELIRDIKTYRDKLVADEALGMTYRHCIRKYRPLLYSEQWARTRFAVCSQTAKTVVEILTTAAKTSLQEAQSSAYSKLPREFTGCSAYTKSPQQYEICVVTNITWYAHSIDASLRQVDKNLVASLFTVTDVARDAIKCSFETERYVLRQISYVNTMLDKCVDELLAGCSCARDMANYNSTYFRTNMCREQMVNPSTNSMGNPGNPMGNIKNL